MSLTERRQIILNDYARLELFRTKCEPGIQIFARIVGGVFTLDQLDKIFVNDRQRIQKEIDEARIELEAHVF